MTWGVQPEGTDGSPRTTPASNVVVKSVFENSVRSCGERFWRRPRRRGRSIPAAGCDGRANAGCRRKIRRPEGFRGKGRLASLLLGHRPLRVCSLVAPRQAAFSAKTGPHGVFKQALSEELIHYFA